MKSENTYNRILDHALSQAVTVGLEGLSFGALASAVGLSKSGLFAHFKSKSDLQRAVVERALKCFNEEVVRSALETEAGIERVRALYENYLDWFAGKKSLEGCPFVFFIQEVDEKPGEIRDLLKNAQVEWRFLLKENVSIAQSLKQTQNSVEPEQIVFELIGAALSFQMSSRLLKEKQARDQAMRAFDSIVFGER